MTTTRMIAIGATVLLALTLIGDGLVAVIVIGLAALGLLLLTASSRPDRPSEDRGIDAALGGKQARG